MVEMRCNSVQLLILSANTGKSEGKKGESKGWENRAGIFPPKRNTCTVHAF